MLKGALKTLEYDKILERLRECASSNFGKELAWKTEPVDDAMTVRENLSLTTEAVKIFAVSAPPLGGFRDIRETLKKIKLGSVADSEEFLDVLSTMYTMRQVKNFFKETEVDAPQLKSRAREIEILGNLERQLDNAIDDHGAVKDTASVELQKIRRELRSTQNRIKTEIFNILHDTAKQKFFQDALVTMRGDRYVLPVKAEYKSQFHGIVHDQSATGATVFIEPMAVVNLNNEVKELEAQERHEVSRILRGLSEAVRKNSDTLTLNINILAEVDLLFAKAKLAEEMNATEPIISDFTDLKAARHPLINPSIVVPVDIRLGENFSMLLVTGPNTGGKTVSMKTLGLMALMAQSGMYIPAAIGSRIAVFTNIFADIGDEQSIEQSLSTFSAHMTKIVSILNEVTATDLVLLDEIGAGTDPDEGSALAMAILERLLNIGAATIATTHYSELKTFAYSTDGIENACVEFNTETLRPTYKLLIGIPGASNAFAIGQRLGLSKSIILRAKQLVTEEFANFEKVLSDLENERMMYEQRNAEIFERQQQVIKHEKKISAMRDEIAKTKGDIIRKAKEKSAAMVRETKREAEEIIAALKEQFDDSGVKRRQQVIQQARDKLREAEAESVTGIISEKFVGKRINKKRLQIGDTVYIKTIDQKGTLLSIEKDGAELCVQIGAMRTTVKSSVCRFVSHNQQEETPSVTTTTSSDNRGSYGLMQKAATITRSIDIRGMTVDEAEQVCGKFIDDAQLSGLKNILIIHGKGTGALRQGVHEFLRRTGAVANFQFADIDEGGTGATLVTVK
ncbi:MAG: endonuclease MutS2 [Selenomonadaceae bacterium]|nr:endonuclease MutS2 [Selenomonadaceae bacterium]